MADPTRPTPVGTTRRGQRERMKASGQIDLRQQRIEENKRRMAEKKAQGAKIVEANRLKNEAKVREAQSRRYDAGFKKVLGIEPLDVGANETLAQAQARNQALRQIQGQAGTVTPERQEEIQQARLQESGILPGLEEAGAFEEAPREVEDISPAELPDIPQLTPVGKLFPGLVDNVFLKPITTTGESIGFADLDEDVQLEFLRQQGLNEIQIQGAKKAANDVNSLGQTLEGVGLGKVAQFIPGASLSGQPSDYVAEIEKEIQAQITALANNEADVRKGFLTAESGLKKSQEIDREIQIMEGKLKFMTSASPELQSNPENILDLQVKLQTLQDASFALRRASAATQIQGVVEPDTLNVASRHLDIGRRASRGN